MAKLIYSAITSLEGYVAWFTSTTARWRIT